ncbi:protein FAM171A1-like isoform X2 [Myxocyprinus asiaticus]|uniref:protein FAM171A1-like isoform X2 n=1 Tax=Myxocyprinus asiaticus TaxID=70543 RepID=UPI0022216D7B|nr:protein FAM171A1-like isoform X2 [Myxocyprinus asiaticus]
MRGADRGSRSAVIVLCLLGCDIWTAAAKTLQEDSDAKEVVLKVHLSDASTHQPLSGVTVEIFTNHTPVATDTSGADGNAFIRFPYRLGDLLVVTATKRGYVPNSVPWQPSRLPVFSSLSLDLLPERAATLMVYEDVVQIVSGYQGSKLQPWVQFQRRALSLPSNATYTNLTAFLTVSSSTQETQYFPYLQDLHSNYTGSERKFELTPVAAISVHLLSSDGAELHVSEPISVSVPLPENSGLKENDHIPAWRFDPKLGAWLKSSLGYVQREGKQLTLTYIAPQLGYWVAAMSPINTGPVVAKDISTYHTVFLLAILGGMALILLFLLCLLLYYCRRKCARLRPAHRKFTLSLALDGSKRDQATSMSHLNLINETHLDHNKAEPDMHTPMLKPTPYDSSTNELAASQDELHSRGSNHYKHSVEIFPLKSACSNNPSEGYDSATRGEYRRSYTSITTSSVHPLHMSVSSSSPHPLHLTTSAGRLSSESKSSFRDPRLSPVTATLTSPVGSPEREQGIEWRPTDYMLSRSVDHLERPAPLPRPGALLCCTSELQVSQGEETYRKARPTLVIPAHYMRLPGTHPLSGQALLLQSDEQSELESIQAELSACHQPQGQVPHPWGKGKLEGRMQGVGEDQGRGVDEWTLQTAAVPADLSIPNSLSQAGLDVVQMNGEDQLLAEKTLMALRGGKPLPHPRAWFVSLDGRSNADIRHSYIDLQRAGCNNSCVGSNDASLDSGVDMSDVTPGRRVRDISKVQGRDRVRSEKGAQPAVPMVEYAPLVFVEDTNTNVGASSSPTPVGSPEENSEGPLLQEGEKVEEEEKTLSTPLPPLLPPQLPSPPLLPEPVDETPEETVTESEVFRTEDTQMHTSNSRPDNLVVPDDSGEDENKKSPWQKREERPLLAFNVK